MRERALFLVLIGACLLSLLVAYWQHETVQETLREVERLTAQHESKSSQLQSAVKKSVELSQQITRLTDESVQHQTAAAEAESEARRAREEAASERRRVKEDLETTIARLEAALDKKAQERAALGEKVAALESAVGGLTARLGEDREATQTRLQEVMDLVSGDSKVLQNLQTRLTDLPEKVDELSSLLRESATPETLAELARLAAWLDEHKAVLQSVNKKIEILGKMLAVDGSSVVSTGKFPPRIEATVAVVDSVRNEIALSGDLAELRPGHIVWISRDGVSVGRAEVFRVSANARLAAARIVWTLPGLSLAEGDRVTTDRPVYESESPAPPGREKGRSEKDKEAPGTREARPKTPISSEGGGAGVPLIRPHPPPPKRPDD